MRSYALQVSDDFSFSFPVILCNKRKCHSSYLISSLRLVQWRRILSHGQESQLGSLSRRHNERCGQCFSLLQHTHSHTVLCVKGGRKRVERATCLFFSFSALDARFYIQNIIFSLSSSPYNNCGGGKSRFINSFQKATARLSPSRQHTAALLHLYSVIIIIITIIVS
jgi:hypothetical protein